MSRMLNEHRDRIVREARNRCGYCLTPQELLPMPLELEHIVPQAAGGSDDETNLWLACRNCNGFKHTKKEAADPVTSDLVELFNPRTQYWKEHFEFSDGGIKIVGKTACGRATVLALRLNFDMAVRVRRKWIEISCYPPKV